MPRDPADLHEIEKRALARFKERGLEEVEEFDLGHYPENVRSLAVNVGVESGRNKGETARNTFEQGVELRVILVCKDYSDGGDEEQKRSKTLPIVQEMLKILALQNLGLQIKRIVPVGFRYRTSPEAFQKGFIVWELNFSTSFYFEFEPDEEPLEIRKIFVDYFLQDTIEEERFIADASDEIETKD